MSQKILSKKCVSFSQLGNCSTKWQTLLDVHYTKNWVRKKKKNYSENIL